MEKINTDNLLRDDFEMFTVSQLHNALWVVVQFERHCWLSLATGIFLHHIERCCQKSVLLKTLQGPANKFPPSLSPPSAARVGPDCWKATQAVWPLSKLGHFGNRHTQVLASLLVAWWGHLWGLGWVNTHDPRQTFTIQPGVQTGGRKNTRKNLTMQKQYDCLWWTPTNAEREVEKPTNPGQNHRQWRAYVRIKIKNLEGIRERDSLIGLDTRLTCSDWPLMWNSSSPPSQLRKVRALW